ncbi:MAG: D-amino acid dehydrogenase, partial [Pseudomonadota bacterium]
EVWNSWGTVLKGLKWMTRSDAPLLMNPRPSWHKISWMAEFLANIPRYRHHTTQTAAMAVAARRSMAQMADTAGIDFDLERRGILHIYRSAAELRAAERVSALLAAGGLERRTVTPDEMRRIEPTLRGEFAGGCFTETDSTGDIHKFTAGLAAWLQSRGVRFEYGADVRRVTTRDQGVEIETDTTARYDAVVVSAGVGSRGIARGFGDRVNIYPVKGYSITVMLRDAVSQAGAPQVSLLDDKTKIVTSRLGAGRFRVAGTAEFNGENRDIRADRIRPLVDWVEACFPDVSTEDVVPWAGLRPMMPSMMPRVGQGRHARVFYNTGHGHLGWTLSGATSEIVSTQVAAALRGRNLSPSGGALVA